MSDPNIAHMGLQVNSLSFGEAISKVARHKLCLLCLREIEKDLIGEGKLPAPKNRGRGRPRSPSTVLATRVGVCPDTIRRWADLSKIQSCDFNAVKLAETAYGYDPEETIKILMADIQRHREAIENWINGRLCGKFPQGGQTQNIDAGAYVENIEAKEAA